MKYAGILLVVFLLAACVSEESAAPTSDAPRLINEETLPPPTITPLRLLTRTPTIAGIGTPTQPLIQQTVSASLLVTVTPPDSPTPTITDTATLTRTPTRTRTPTPSLTPTATMTFTPSITFTPSRTFTPSPTAEGVLPCSYTWFFSPAPPNCPQTNAVVTPAAFQAMQNGAMVWTQSGLTIYVMFNDTSSPGWVVAPDTFVEGEPEVDFNLQVPPGLLQPRRGFGKLWRSDRPLQQRLGWASTAELGYTASVQSDSVTGIRYISGPHGEIFALLPDQSRWYREK